MDDYEKELCINAYESLTNFLKSQEYRYIVNHGNRLSFLCGIAYGIKAEKNGVEHVVHWKEKSVTNIVIEKCLIKLKNIQDIKDYNSFEFLFNDELNKIKDSIFGFGKTAHLVPEYKLTKIIKSFEIEACVNDYYCSALHNVIQKYKRETEEERTNLKLKLIGYKVSKNKVENKRRM